jgi:hypothetical protein
MQEALSNAAYAGGCDGFVRPATEPRLAPSLFETVLVGFAIFGLVAAELMLSGAIRGTNFAGADGKMAQAVIVAAYKFAGSFQFNNINPLQGLGSQLLPINVWINPTYWPFAILDKAQASNVSAGLALGIFALACYLMGRCFDVPIVPSAVAAQLSIVLFGPLVYLLQLSTVFSLMVGNAVVYAPYMVALGLLVRIEPGSWRSFALITAGIFALLFYSVCCDPLWSVVCCSSWALPFVIGALSPMRPKAVLVPLRSVGVLSLASGRQWCGRISSHPDPVHRTIPVPGAWRSSAFAGFPCVRSLLFAIHEIFLLRLGIGLAARPMDIARSGPCPGYHRHRQLCGSARTSLVLFVVGECAVVISASSLRRAKPAPVIPGFRCCGLLGRRSNRSPVGPNPHRAVYAK